MTFGRINAYTFFRDKARFTGIEETAAIIGVAASVAGAAVTAYSAIQQGDAAAAAARYNQQVADQNAAAAKQQAEQDAQIQKAQSQQLLGAQAAAYGASGVTNEGSALDVLGNTASNAELARQTILYKGQLKAAGYSDEAILDQANAATAESNATFSASGALLKGFGTAAVQAKSAGLIGSGDNTGKSTTFGSNGGP